MRRTNFRLAAVVAVLLTFSFVLPFPAAEAGDLVGSRATRLSSMGWFDAILAGIDSLLDRGQVSHRAGPKHRPSATPTGGNGSGNTAKTVPNTGSCIDPMGGTHC